jgi:hypothetical protein
VKQSGAQEGERQIHSRPRGGDKHRIEFRAAQRAEVHRHRLCVAEQKWRVRDHQQRWQKNCAERVDVLQRIEAHPALTPSRCVLCDKTVRRLVKGDRDDEWNDPGRDLIEGQSEP